MAKVFIKDITRAAKLYRDSVSGVAWIEDGTSGCGFSAHPNISKSGSVNGMKKLGYWDWLDVVVPTEGFWYNTSRVSIDGEFDRIAENFCQCRMCLLRKLEWQNEEANAKEK